MDYVDPAASEVQLKRLTSSPSMYVRIKSWLLSGDDGPQEEIRGDCVNQKVCSVSLSFVSFLRVVPLLIRVFGSRNGHYKLHHLVKMASIISEKRVLLQLVFFYIKQAAPVYVLSIQKHR